MSFDIAYNIIAIDKFSKVSQKISNEFSRLDQKVRKFSSSMNSMGAGFSKVGRNISLGAGIPLALLARQSIKTAATFERSMNMVQAVSGATANQFKELNKQSMELGATTQFTAAQVASGQKFLAMAGFKTNKILQATPAALRLAAATQSDFGDAANIVTNIMTGYRIKADGMNKANDMIVATLNNTNTNLQMMGSSMKLVAPVASAAGIKFKETAAMIGLLGNAGIQGTLAGTSLRRAFANMLAPTSSMIKVMKKGKITFTDSNGQLMSMVNILKELKKSGITAAGMMSLFGLRAGPAMQALLSQGSTALVKLENKLSSSGGLAKRIADVQMRGLTGAFLKLKSAAQGLAITTTKSVEPSLLSMSNKMTSWILKANNSSDSTKRWAARLVGLGIVLGPLLGGFGKFLVYTSLFASSIPGVITLVSGLASGFVALWAAILSPLGLVIAGVALLGVGIFELAKHFKSIRPYLISFGKGFIEYIINPMGFAEKEAKKLIRVFERLFHKKHLTMNSSVYHSGMISHQQQKVHSTLDVNVTDPQRFITSIVGKTSSGDLNLDLGSNMAHSR